MQQFLDTSYPISLHDILKTSTFYYKLKESMQYPLQIQHNGSMGSAVEFLSHAQSYVFLYGSGGAGKSTLLVHLQGKNRFFLSLSNYGYLIFDPIHPTRPCWILVQILLKYRYFETYTSLDACIACEGQSAILQELTELHHLLNRQSQSPEYLLMLDGWNEASLDLRDELTAELRHIFAEWHNCRLIISGRVIPDACLFSQITPAKLTGIPESERDTVLHENNCIPEDAAVLELLCVPLFLNLYLQSVTTDEAVTTRSEILDAYFRHLCPDDTSLLAFIVHFVFPIAVNVMMHSSSQVLTRADLSEAADTAFSLYLERERVYQNLIVPRRFRRDVLKQIASDCDIPALLTEHFGFLESDAAGQLRFTHQYFRDYFAARHYVNLMELFSICYDGRHIADVKSVFDQFDMGAVWFPGEDDDAVYALIGELCGDYRNIPDDDYLIYQRSVMDDYLDFCREFDHFRTTENIMRIMELTRKGIVCGVDFSRLSLPFTMPEGTYFSANGVHPCDFSDSKVLGVFASSIPENYDPFVCDETILPAEGCPQYYLNCDFSGADFFPIAENREILRRYGASLTDDM